MSKAIDKEQARWQEAINDLCCKLAPEANIDGGGCDSGDPLDFSLAEIAQAVNYHVNLLSDAAQIIKDDCPEGGTAQDVLWACEEVAKCDALFRQDDALMQIAEGTDDLVGVISILWNRLQEAEGTLSPLGQQISDHQRKQAAKVPYAYCCNGDPTTCDCVNPNHGTAQQNNQIQRTPLAKTDTENH